MLTLQLTSTAQSNQNSGHFSDIRMFGGINLSSLSSDGTQITLVDSVIHSNSVDAQLGYQGGVSFTYGNHFYVSPGLWYSKFTLNSYLIDESQPDNDIDFEKESNISMLTIPIRFGFRFIDPNSSNIFNIRLYGGVTGQHVLSVDTSGDPEIELDKSDYEDIVVNATAGLGVDVLFLFMDIGYDLGLSNFEKSNSNSRHNSMFVNVGAKFRL
jgi:hypothetical protein